MGMSGFRRKYRNSAAFFNAFFEKFENQPVKKKTSERFKTFQTFLR
jgi:hypothetical protein